MDVVSLLSLLLSYAPGGTLLLQGLLLANTTLASPQGAAFLPLALQLPATTRLKLQDIQMVVSQQQLQQYAAFLQQVPSAVFVTDNTSFIHVRNFSSIGSVLAAGKAADAAAAASAAGDASETIVDAYSVTLIAPMGAAIRNTPITVLQALAASRASQQQNGSVSSAGVDETALAAATGNAAGIVTATDSYVLAARDSTLLQLLQQLNSEQQQASSPLLIHLASNVSLASRFWGSSWPAGGLAVRRPVVFVGSGWRPTSMDLGMEVGQVSTIITGAPSDCAIHCPVKEGLAGFCCCCCCYQDGLLPLTPGFCVLMLCGPAANSAVSCTNECPCMRLASIVSCCAALLSLLRSDAGPVSQHHTVHACTIHMYTPSAPPPPTHTHTLHNMLRRAPLLLRFRS
jgi:hypothetical protein